MINLEVVGALDRCATFKKPLDIRRVSKIRASDKNTKAFIRENLEALEAKGGNLELEKALRRVLMSLCLRERTRKIFNKLRARVNVELDW